MARSSRLSVASSTIAVAVSFKAILPAGTLPPTRAAITSLSAFNSSNVPVTNSTPSAPSAAIPWSVFASRAVRSDALITAVEVASSTLKVTTLDGSRPSVSLLVSARRSLTEELLTVAVIAPVVLSSIALN